MYSATQREHLSQTSCEVRFDGLVRTLYATDASIYQVEPMGVAFPRNAEEASAVIRAAIGSGVPVIPRGAGTGLAGGAIGEGLVVDFAKHNREISHFDPEQRTVRVGAGVVLDQLNLFLKPHGLIFGPDVATSSRATLGGMIANDSSGARAPLYGTTAEHVASMQAVLADGRIVEVGAGYDTLADMRQAVDEIVQCSADTIRERRPDTLAKHWSGYGIDRYLRQNGNLVNILSGSEGTLAGIMSAELKLVHLPQEKALALYFFDSVEEAMQATVEFLDLKPAAIEHIDRLLLDQTRGQHAFKSARSLMELDDKPCEAMLIVEFYDNVGDKIAALEQRRVGNRHMVVVDPKDMAMIWALRKAGLSLLTGRKGPAKPIAGIEDAAVRPEQLPDYVRGLQDIMGRLDVQGSFYGHAAAGLLHVRPVIDLHEEHDIKKFRALCDEVADLVAAFKGSLAAEHGVGMARTEYMAAQLGPELMDAMRAVKNLFDPEGLLNPGKLIPDGRFAIDTLLRQGAGHRIELPFDPVLAFAAKDESFVGNLEQCNGCGGCRKDEPTMCPTYLATGEEIMSTRGRTNAIRAAMEHRVDGEPLESQELSDAISNCLACKACTNECPSNVNMTLLKAELLYARQRRRGLMVRERMVSEFDRSARMASLAPGMANFMMRQPWVRRFMDQYIGFTKQRPFPTFARQRFDTWFKNHTPKGDGRRGLIYLWDDTSVRHCEPEIGKAAVAVLEAAGYRVALASGHVCSGRPAFSTGRLDYAKKCGQKNVNLFKRIEKAPIVFLEPSDYSMFVEDYRELGVNGWDEVAAQCQLFEDLLYELLKEEPDAVKFTDGFTWVAVHSHCHTKAIADPATAERLARLLPNSEVVQLNTGCCGMAGQFGQLSEKYDLSVKVAEPLVHQINELRAGTDVVACGTSCRHQIDHLTPVRPLHIAELLAQNLA